ncbi:anionic trypsin-2-like [Dermacentor albipictus]|uniref:anionic trypsin-2-like n=1 Tax=Dermacentor albipictus TaxID=60249 RepID=UPI0031FDB5F0
MMLSVLTLVILSSLLSTQVLLDSINPPGCGVARVLGRIVAGKTIARSRIPWIVHLVARYQFKPRSIKKMACGGSILSRRFILTAAHCIHFGYRLPVSILVRYNSTYLGRGPLASAKDVIPHPRFSMDTVANDIGLVKLTKPLQFDKFVKPICLPMTRLQLVHKKAFAAGWGKTRDTGVKGTHRLHYIKTNILPFRNCTTSFDPWMQQDVFTDASVICTKTNGKGVCQGDSGGPVTVWRKRQRKYFQVGVVSFSRGCSKAGHPNVHTRVSHFVHWIRNMMWIR